MNLDALYLLFMLILMLALLGYFLIKDKENITRLAKFEKEVEELHKKIHYLRKQLEDKNTQNEVDYEGLFDETKKLITKELNTKILPILKSLQGVESVIEEFQNEQENRLAHLEQKTQNISKLSPDYENEEQKIIEYFKQGKSIEQIAKELRISTGNIEFVLKMKELL